LKQWLSITTCCHVLAATVNYVHVNIWRITKKALLNFNTKIDCAPWTLTG
jgi:hypothetical protein